MEAHSPFDGLAVQARDSRNLPALIAGDRDGERIESGRADVVRENVIEQRPAASAADGNGRSDKRGAVRGNSEIAIRRGRIRIGDVGNVRCGAGEQWIDTRARDCACASPDGALVHGHATFWTRGSLCSQP